MKLRNFTALRHFSSLPSSSQVRVRFAPSPTGALHLGGLRTAFYNWLLARSTGGSFILRIEDTDQTRLVDGATEKFHATLKSFGIAPDESPETGGPTGPYRQSERLDTYRVHAEQLIHSGHAYRCFCSTERLDLLRREQLRRQATPRYDNRCRSIAPDESARRALAGEPYTIRVRYDKQDVDFQDDVYGHVTCVADEGDWIALKSDGWPTYHFASVCDDHTMRISHVLRGQEWLTSTPKHVLLYGAFGWRPPRFLHLPLLMRDAKHKMSKRDGDAFVDHYVQKRGCLPLALLNYLIRNGCGIRNHSTLKLYSLDELVASFDPGTLTTTPLTTDESMLEHYGRLALKKGISEKDAWLENEIRSRLRSLVPEEMSEKSLSSAHISRVLKHVAENEERVHCLDDLVRPPLLSFFVAPSSVDALLASPIDPNSIRAVLQDLQCADMEWTDTFLTTVGTRHGLSKAQVCRVIRSAVVDVRHGPPISEMVQFFGMDECRRRLQAALTRVQDVISTRKSSTVEERN